MSDTKIDLSLFFDEKPEEKGNNNETKVKDSDKRENNDSHDRIDSIDKAINFINENIKEKPLESSETQSVNTPLENTEDKPLNITDKETKVETKTIASDEIAKKASIFNEEDLFEELKNIFKDVPENAEKCYNLINPDSRGFRAYFVGEMTGTKGTILKELNKLLFKLGKVKTDRYVNLAFNEIEELEEWDTQTLYVVSNLTDAYVNLFASKGQSEQDKTTSRYSRMLESLIKAPLNAYIILDSADRTSQRNFLDIDPRIGFLFSNTCIFPDFSDDKIANDLIKRIEVYPTFNSNPISNTDVVDFLDGNRKFYPFKNNELTNYLDMIYRSTGNLPPSKEDSFNLENSLNQFIGMEDAKTIIRRMEKYLRARRLFKENGIDTSKAQFSLHTALIGPAGTGKTSLARVLSKLYFQMGFLPSEKLVEIGGIDLMGANEAQSAAKAAKAVSEAMGGALFIDEVYGLSSDAAIACIVKNMTDNVDNFAVFIAGYQKETRIWLARNTGLQSRIGTYININPYTEEELIQIYFMKMKNMGFTIKDSPEMRKKLAPLISYAIRDRNSGNGRFCERMSQSTLLMISNKYFEDPSRDISIVDADVIPPISEIIKSFS